ncbi:MAG: antitoxin [Candidatus Dormibacteria bacterium]
MKTTLELPDELMRAAKIRAATEGRRLKDVMADLIRGGLAAEPKPVGKVRRRVQLPLIKCPHRATPAEEMTPARVADVLIQADAESARNMS